MFKITQYPSSEQCVQVALQAFGTAEKVGDVQKWFVERRAQQFAKAEERLHRRCGAVTQGVLHDVERLLRQTRGMGGMNGRCTVANLKIILGNHGLTNSGSKAELIQRVHNNINSIREALGLQPDDAVDVEEHVQGDAESDDGDEGELVCFAC
uniref:SAP domain-containing protein n=1 Tax=Eutreptiella gymnastica TaxID=73025 RepID=A0A7S1JCR9_9EUGL